MNNIFSIPLVACVLLLTGCRSSDDSKNSSWIHRGATYSNSTEYLEAIDRDKFARHFPPEAGLADFRSFDDRRLGLYYFHYLRAVQPGHPKLSSATQTDLEKALQERGLTAEHRESIANGRLQKGMPAAALFAAWGPPLESYRTTTPDGPTTQHIYLDENGQQISIFTLNNRLTFH